MRSTLVFDTSEQGTPEWLKARLGVITASKAHALMPDKKTGKPKLAARKTLMSELISSIMLGEAEEAHSSSMEWGKKEESSAISAFIFNTGKKVSKSGLVYMDKEKRIACSPDGLILEEKLGVETKSPSTMKPHVDFILFNEIKDEYVSQCHFSIWVLDFNGWYFNSYQPKACSIVNHQVLIERDNKIIEFLNNEIPPFIELMNENMEKIGIKWGQQWS